MVCCPCQCYPCVRFLGIVKTLCGIGLLVLGVFMFFNRPNIFDCNKLSSSCPAAFTKMTQGESGTSPPVPSGSTATTFAASNTAEIQSYCECLSSCVNYMLVYERNQIQNVSTNCFQKSKAAGVPSLGTNQRRLQEMGTSDDGLLNYIEMTGMVGRWTSHVTRHSHAPGFTHRRLEGANTFMGLAGKANCVACEDVAGGQHTIFFTLGAVAIHAGIFLLLSGVCEHYQIKLHSFCYSMLVFIFDVVVVIELKIVMIVSFVSALSASFACDPDLLEKTMKDAGEDSTNGNADSAAAFAQFFIKIFAPVGSKLCHERTKFSVFFCISALGFLGALISTMIVCCVCCHLTADGAEVPNEHKGAMDNEAEEMQTLMGGGVRQYEQQLGLAAADQIKEQQGSWC